MTKLFRALVAFAFVCNAAASITPKKTSLSSHVNKQLSARGGAGPLDPTAVAKLATGTLLAQGAVSVMAPGPSVKHYGNDPTPISTLCMRRIGISSLSVGAMAFGMIFKGWSVNSAAATEAFIWSSEILRGTLNDEASKMSYDNTGLLVWLVIDLAVAYLALTNASCANTVIKAFASFIIVTCAPIMFFPVQVLKVYGFVDEPSALDKSYFKVQGAWLVAIGIFLVSVASGVDPMKALGYAYAPATLLMLVQLFVTKEAAQTGEGGSPKVPLIAWLLINLATLGTLAID